MQKVAGLQGPIDDAFTAPFLCVRGTGSPWNEAAQRYADASLNQFQTMWEKYSKLVAYIPYPDRPPPPTTTTSVRAGARTPS